MIPIRDDNPQIRVPWVTYAIVVLNVLAWVLLQGVGSEPALTRSICQLGMIPGDLLGQLGQASAYERLPCAVDGQASWSTVLSSMFMHGSWMHIIGNMWFLWIFGDNVEDAMGHVRFVLFYLLCGLAAAAAQVAADPASSVPMVGASGAIGGVMGAYILLYPRVRVHMLFVLVIYVTTIAVPAYFMLGYWFLVQVLSGVASYGAQGGGVAFWAHIGGFVAGGVLIYVFRDMKLLARHPYHGWAKKASLTQNWHRIDRKR